MQHPAQLHGPHRALHGFAGHIGGAESQNLPVVVQPEIREIIPADVIGGQASAHHLKALFAHGVSGQQAHLHIVGFLEFRLQFFDQARLCYAPAFVLLKRISGRDQDDEQRKPAQSHKPRSLPHRGQNFKLLHDRGRIHIKSQVHSAHFEVVFAGIEVFQQHAVVARKRGPRALVEPPCVLQGPVGRLLPHVLSRKFNQRVLVRRDLHRRGQKQGFGGVSIRAIMGQSAGCRKPEVAFGILPHIPNQSAGQPLLNRIAHPGKTIRVNRAIDRRRQPNRAIVRRENARDPVELRLIRARHAPPSLPVEMRHAFERRTDPNAPANIFGNRVDRAFGDAIGKRVFARFAIRHMQHAIHLPYPQRAIAGLANRNAIERDLHLRQAAHGSWDGPRLSIKAINARARDDPHAAILRGTHGAHGRSPEMVGGYHLP